MCAKVPIPDSYVQCVCWGEGGAAVDLSGEPVASGLCNECILISVVFPAPLAPSSPVTPSDKVKETRSTAILFLYCLLNLSTDNLMPAPPHTQLFSTVQILLSPPVQVLLILPSSLPFPYSRLPKSCHNL